MTQNVTLIGAPTDIGAGARGAMQDLGYSKEELLAEVSAGF